MIAPLPRGPKIAVVGNCQVSGIGASLRRLAPESTVKMWHVGVNPVETRQQTLDRLRDFDLVVSQIRKGPHDSLLDIDHLQATLPAVIFVPPVVFHGFQPDCIYLSSPQGTIKDGLGDMHSAIIAACYVLGRPAADVPQLFNAFVYGNFGYFDMFAIAREHFLSTFAAAGYDLARSLDQWMLRHGAFMYTPNHPRICVLSTLATMIAQRAGLVDQDVAALDDVDDMLAQSVQWPAYPELARRLGIPGATSFVRSQRFETTGGSRALTLPDFIAHCYATYDRSLPGVVKAGLPPRGLATLEGLLGA